MTLEFEVPVAAIEGRRNFRAVEWPKFREALLDQLGLMPDPCTLSDEAQFQEVVNDLTSAIQAAIQQMVPTSKPSPYSRHWWNEDLSCLKRQMNRLGSESYRHHAVTDHLSHSLHSKIRNDYGLAIKRVKDQHWKTFLEELSGRDLWMAQWYMTSPVGDGGKACIPTLKMVDSAGHARDLATNEEKSVAFSKIFFPKRPDSDLIPADPEYPCQVNYSFRPSMAQLCRCVTRLSPYKAPREDGIPNINHHDQGIHRADCRVPF